MHVGGCACVTNGQHTIGGGGEIPLDNMDKLLVWNVGGVNQIKKQNIVKQFIRTKIFGLVGLLETRVKMRNMGNLYLNVLFCGWCCSSNITSHPGGRIVVSWRHVAF